MSYKKAIGVVAVFAGTLIAAQAAVVLNFNNLISGTQPGGTGPFVTVTITDVATNKINLRVDHNAGSASGQFVSYVMLNLGAIPGSPAFSSVLNQNKLSGNNTSAIQFGNDAFNGVGGANFDLRVNFNVSNAGGGVNRLKAGEFFSTDISAVGLDSSDFGSVVNGRIGEVHVQGIGQDGEFSGKLDAVPEPGTMVALGLGAIALIRKRRR